MPKTKKSLNRQTRREERQRRRDDSKLFASLDRSIPSVSIRKTESVEPLTRGQRHYDSAFQRCDIVFGIGPAGTGKTWFAIQRAAEALTAGLIEKIYVTRPAVEVGEGMGFLPGDLAEKYEPYLSPLKEAFTDALGSGRYEYLVKNMVIEAVPLAFMRGRTFKNAWMIADEMQNASKTEMKMFLTRIGENAKFIINGDTAQIDDGVSSGLEDAVCRIGEHRQVSVTRFSRDEVVRSGLCQDIVDAYEN